MRRSLLGRVMVIALTFVALQQSPTPASAHGTCTLRIYLVVQSGFGVWAQHDRQCQPHYKYKARFWVEVRQNGQWTKLARTDDGLQTDCCDNTSPLFASTNSPCVVVGSDTTQTYRAHLSTTYTVSTTGNIAHKATNLFSPTQVLDAFTDC
jgi:hypothetical protein